MCSRVFRPMGILFFFLFASVAVGQTNFEVIGWNVESGGADPAVNAQRIAAAQGVEIWGLCEARASSATTYTTAAEDGETPPAVPTE